MRALIGQKPCLDQAIQTQKSKLLSREFLLLYKTITLWFLCLDDLIQTLGKVARVKKSMQNGLHSAHFYALFLTLATFPRVWIRPSKYGNHKVIVYSNPPCTHAHKTSISIDILCGNVICVKVHAI